MTNFKVDLIESWQGSAFERRSQARNQKGARVALKVARHCWRRRRLKFIRATGHGWCLAQEKGCGGAGLYETTRCGM